MCIFVAVCEIPELNISRATPHETILKAKYSGLMIIGLNVETSGFVCIERKQWWFDKTDCDIGIVGKIQFHRSLTLVVPLLLHLCKQCAHGGSAG